MLLRRFYYSLKPFLPQELRLSMRRWRARSLLPRVKDVWPIHEAAGKAHDGWPGWPEGRQFAFVLSHDIEDRGGLEKCRQLASLEMDAGFRSSFNFIPEGGYRVPADLRRWLVANKFEVGVHDLHHDGKLYHSQLEFRRHAGRINQYLREWEADGFRSGFMLRNLGWLHDLEILYDASTFDTDPFEPQPQGAGTIFPFWVPAPSISAPANSSLSAGGEMATGYLHPPSATLHPRPSAGSGYVELPYTLPQDSTMFLVLRLRNADVWKRKLDWLAERGGMALLDTHPDYMRFDGVRPSFVDYDAAIYREFLEFVKTRYHGRYWHALPREVARYACEWGCSSPQAFKAFASVACA